MKNLIAPLCAACALVFTAHGTAGETEWDRNQNAQKPRQGTHETRSAERKVRRAELKTQIKAGAVPKPEEDWGMNKNKPAPVAGTHETRSAERKVRRAEMKKVIKAGELPVTNESVVSQPRK